MHEEESLTNIIAIISRTLAQMEAKAIEAGQFADLSMKQVLYLETIAKMDAPTFTDVAEALGVSKPSVTAIVNKLQRKGYVKRERSQTDRRVYHIVLTEAGEHIRQLHGRLHEKMAEVFTSRLNEAELQSLHRILYKVFGDEHTG